MAVNWTAVGNLRGPQGNTGPAGAAGTSIVSAVVNGSGDLIVTYSNNAQTNAGHVVGNNGTSANFESAVATVNDLPASPALNSLYLVTSDPNSTYAGSLFVYEGNAATNEGKTGYTRVGRIKGDTGSTGPTGPQGNRGLSMFSSTGMPSGTDSMYVAGDTYLDYTTGILYKAS